MKKITFLLIAGALFVGNGSQLHAQILNGSFSTSDFTDWSTVGGTSGGPTVVTSGATPPTGTTAALIQSTNDDSGAQSAQVGSISTPGTIDAALGVTLPPTTNSNILYDTGTFTPDNGQAIYQTFSVSTASTLTFAYSYQTNDGYPYDSVGYVLDGVYTQLVQTPPYDPSATTPTPYTFVAPLSLSAGSHTIGFVAYNTDGPSDSTTLYVTDVSTSAVPEPSEWALLLIGGASLLLLRKLRSGVSAV